MLGFSIFQNFDINGEIKLLNSIQTVRSCTTSITHLNIASDL